MKNTYGKTNKVSPSPAPSEPYTYIKQVTPRFSWLFIIIVCAVAFSPALIFPASQTFFGGLAALLFSTYSLYHVYYTNTLKTNFRAGCYIWLLLLGGIFMMIVGVGEMVAPSAPAPTSTHTRTTTPYPTATRSRPPTITPEPCLLWSKVTPQMVGTETCVYGTVSYYKESHSIGQSFIYFGTEDQFFFTSESKWDTSPKGYCVQAFGTIQLNTYRVPYILIDKLYTCD